MRYAIVIEKAQFNYSAYCPDLPECVATGNTIEEVKKEMTEGDCLSFRRIARRRIADTATDIFNRLCRS